MFVLEATHLTPREIQCLPIVLLKECVCYAVLLTARQFACVYARECGKKIEDCAAVDLLSPQGKD